LDFADLWSEPQIGVLRVPGINDCGLRGQPGTQLIGERPGAARQAGLGAELLKQPLALLPGQQLRGPVRVRLRPLHGDIPGPQLRGEIREHARLEVTAMQLPWMITIDDDPLPLL
jgi:hypothetical protein